MKGRQETNLKTELSINRLLTNAPTVVSEYALCFTRNTMATKAQYIRCVLDFLKYLKERGYDVDNAKGFQNIQKRQIVEYMEHIRYRVKNGVKIENKESTRAMRLFAIAHFFDFLVENEYVDKNPCDKVEKPKSSEEKEVIAMTEEETTQLKYNIKEGAGTHRAVICQKPWKNRDLALITLGCSTGLRVTSMCEINVSDVDFNNLSIIVTEKGNKTRTCYIGENTAQILKDWLEDRSRLLGEKEEEALFISNQRKRISSKSVERIVTKYSYNMKKKITPHKLRSTFATGLYEKTGDIYLVQEAIGHKNITNTRRYAKVSENKRRSAANLMD